MPTQPVVPGGARIWQIGDRHFLIYRIPQTNTPIAYRVYPRDRDRVFGPGERPDAHRSMTRAQARNRGVLFMGSAEQLRNTDTHPWEQFNRDFAKEVEIRPWLNDPDMLAIHAGAWLEGREPTEAELKSTEWWRSQTAGQRQWAALVASDPEEARQRLRDGRILAREALMEAGWQGEVPFSLLKHMGDKFTTGEISENVLRQWVRQAVDPYVTNASPYAGYYLPDGAESVTHNGNLYIRYKGKDWRVAGPGARARYGDGAKAVRSVNVAGDALDFFERHGDRESALLALGNHEEVRNLVNRWLGPYYGGGWSDEQIGEWAGKIRRNPNQRDALLEHLRSQRVALFPTHENPNLSYEDIAAPWRQTFTQIWGQQADETDPLFAKVVSMNDAEEARKLLTREGLNRGISTVVANALSDLNETMGGQVRSGVF